MWAVPFVDLRFTIYDLRIHKIHVSNCDPRI